MAIDKQERERLPGTLRRSSAKAQATYIHTLEAAAETHGDGEAAHRIAFGSLRHSFEKVGDDWEPKARRGPSDDQDAKRGADARHNPTETAEGVAARASRSHLLGVTGRLDIPGRTKMTKSAIVDAIIKANRRASAAARADSH